MLGAYTPAKKTIVFYYDRENAEVDNMRQLLLPFVPPLQIVCD